jgi:hypothetical protein
MSRNVVHRSRAGGAEREAAEKSAKSARPPLARAGAIVSSKFSGRPNSRVRRFSVETIVDALSNPALVAFFAIYWVFVAAVVASPGILPTVTRVQKIDIALTAFSALATIWICVAATFDRKDRKAFEAMVALRKGGHADAAARVERLEEAVADLAKAALTASKANGQGAIVLVVVTLLGVVRQFGAHWLEEHPGVATAVESKAGAHRPEEPAALSAAAKPR